MGKRLDGNKAKNIFFGFWMLPEQKKWLDDISTIESKNIASIIRDMIDEKRLNQPTKPVYKLKSAFDQIIPAMPEEFRDE